ncbi:MAG TPA: hypothetical protein VGR02_19850 [Thermoanaerobaculia bacterium]|jgi:hypothetical protein|nr:hypothetical protein [Thermoanaerobaculia bacterium]
MFPQHLERILDAYGVPADTKAALYDLYVAMGDEVLEVFGDIAEGVASATLLRPEDTLTIRAHVVERYLRRNHPQWLDGAPTPSLWHPRELEGRASGLATPLGELSDETRARIGENQPVPDGMVILGRNAHYGGRQETISFDVVARELDDALAIGLAEGQQHTLPGSVGATSGTLDATHRIALLWEVQPNVFKPAGERNRAISKIYRRHRNWHLATLAEALQWLRTRGISTFILRGAALAVTHEVNPQKPVSATIAEHHDRTVAKVADALVAPTDHDELLLLESSVMNHALRRHVLREGAAGAMWRVG